MIQRFIVIAIWKVTGKPGLFGWCSTREEAEQLAAFVERLGHQYATVIDTAEPLPTLDLERFK